MAPGIYIYGIIREPGTKTFSTPGIDGAAVFTINWQDLGAVVSNTQLGEVAPTRRNVRAHTAVQDELLQGYTLLPMSFGMIADGGAKVLRLLEKNRPALTAELARLAGKIEIELKVFWDQEKILKELQARDGQLARLRSNIRVASPVEAEELLVEAGRLVERVALDWKTRYAERVYQALKELAVDARINKTVGVTNILNTSFLIDRSVEGRFHEEIARLDTRYEGKVNFRYIGPLAPYNFVELKLEVA